MLFAHSFTQRLIMHTLQLAYLNLLKVCCLKNIGNDNLDFHMCLLQDVKCGFIYCVKSKLVSLANIMLKPILNKLEQSIQLCPTLPTSRQIARLW